MEGKNSFKEAAGMELRQVTEEAGSQRPPYPHLQVSGEKTLTLVAPVDSLSLTEQAEEQSELGFGSGPDAQRFSDSGKLDV